MRRIKQTAGLAIVFGAGLLVGSLMQPASVLRAQDNKRVFELRTYTAPEGKLDALHARFRDHTRRIFEKHGMTSIGYWVPQDAPLHDNTLIYIIAHPSREAAKKNWADFAADPEWKKVKADSETNAGGPLTTKIDSLFLAPTDYSPMK